MEHFDQIASQIEKLSNDNRQQRRLQRLLNRTINAFEKGSTREAVEAVEQELAAILEKAKGIARRITKRIER